MKFITQKGRFLVCTFLRKKLRKCLVVSDIFCNFVVSIRGKARALVQTPIPLARPKDACIGKNLGDLYKSGNGHPV